jgi:hypothetical protein
VTDRGATQGGYAVLPDLAEATGGDLDRVIGRLAEAIGQMGETGTVRLRFSPAPQAGERRSYVLHLAAADLDGASRNQVELLLAPATLMMIASGAYSPVRAFLDGKLRVRGDVDLAKRVLRHLAGPDGRVDCH